MSDALELLGPPLLVAITLVGIHAYFGIQVLTRGVIFVDLALAQIAALGATVAFMLGHAPQSMAAYGYSLAFTMLAAVLLAFTRNWAARIPQEALIGVIYVVAAAAAILLIDRAPQGAEHLKQIFTGNILTSGTEDLRILVPLYVVIGVLHWLLRRRLAGGASLPWEFVFYASFGVVVTSSVALAGVLLVFSFLIVPAAIGVLHAQTLGRQLLVGWIAGALTSAAGLAASFAFDLPTGAAMVCVFGIALAVAGLAWYGRRIGARDATLRSRRRGALGSGFRRGHVGTLVAGGAACRPAARRHCRSRVAVIAATVLLRSRNRNLRRCAPLRRALPARSRATERARNAQQGGRHEDRRHDDPADLLVPEVLRRNAQGRAVRHERSPCACTRALAVGRRRIAVDRGCRVDAGRRDTRRPPREARHGEGTSTRATRNPARRCPLPRIRSLRTGRVMVVRTTPRCARSRHSAKPCARREWQARRRGWRARDLLPNPA